MKIQLLMILALLGLMSCQDRTKPKKEHRAAPKIEVKQATIKFRVAGGQLLIGNFNEDPDQDTIFQRYHSKLTGKELDSMIHPHENEWDTVAGWFYGQQVNMYLHTNDLTNDSLHLGVARGFHYLNNMGDLNQDGRDEIALVVAHIDYSNVNSCLIYTFCQNKWRLLKKFDINERAFYAYSAEDLSDEDGIKGFLEKRNGQWFYSDYAQQLYATQEGDVKMQQLVIDQCSQ